MLDLQPVEVQVFVFGMVLAVSVPLLLFWLLYHPLRAFLSEIFHAPAVEQFWLRVVLVGFLASTLSVAVVFQPVDSAKSDEVALLFNVADRCKQMLDALILAMLSIFLPLLAAYTLLHMRRRRAPPASTSGEGK